MNPRRLLSLSFAAVTLALGAHGAFEKTNTYTNGLFTDVHAAEWYASEVQTVYELGLMNGIGGGLFDPDGSVTVAEAVTMAARACASSAGETIPAADGEWYQAYVDYAVAKGFVKPEQFDSYDRPAKRYEVACLFENALPDGYYTPRNNVTAIPDVSEKKAYHDPLLVLYKAGVVMGNDAYGNFRPEDNITRAEAAAVITRVALPEKRLSKTLLAVSSDDAYILDKTSNFTVGGGTSGVKSGWLYDNRGGVMTADYRINLDSLADDSETEGIALIREFNRTDTGLMRIETEIDASDPEGIIFELDNDAGKAVYRLEVRDGAWQTLNADGSYTKIADAKAGKTAIYADVDLDNLFAVTSLKGAVNTDGVVSVLAAAKADANILNMRFATTAEAKPHFSITSTNVCVNYAVNDGFLYEADGSAPVGWSVNGAAVTGGELAVGEGQTAYKAFSPVSGKVIAEALVFADRKTKADYALLSGEKTVARITLDGSQFFLDGKPVYEYHDGLWYALRLELDADTEETVLKLNGRVIASDAFMEKTTSVDGVRITGASAETVRFDDFTVFKEQPHDDYVPEPVKPAGEEKYTVGVNVCSLWEEGTHTGWKCITPYERPVLGYYDEANPETADWEIKYMVEHGIDFQAFCWFADANKDYIKTPRLSGQLNKGFMNAKYSDRMKYALLFECNASIGDLDAWKKYSVPYIIEYYFKDPRYMRVDNKAVVCSFDLHKWAWDINLGSVEALKEALDYLEDEAKKIGYDGVIYLSCHSSLTAEENVEVGVDGYFHYSFAEDGARLDQNIYLNEKAAKNQIVYVVPTISMGYNTVAWDGRRSPIMTVSDYNAANKWVVDTYLPEHAQTGTWQDGFVMLSTWNEFGEGTYIAPCENNGGFGYLDAVRSAYTDEAPSASLNTVPTEEQMKRINRRYPQYRQDLKSSYTADLSVQKQVVVSIDPADIFDKISNYELKEMQITEEGLQGLIVGTDPRFRFEDLSDYTIPASEIAYIRVNMKVPKDNVIELFFATDKDPKISQNKSFAQISTSDDMTSYVFEVYKHPQWSGNITSIWIDPVRTVDDTNRNTPAIIKSVDFLSSKDAGLTRRININGLATDANIQPVVNESGDLLLPFDPDTGLEYRLDTFVTWDKAAKTLTIRGEKNMLAFTVGSDVCKIDGKEHKLAYAIDTVNNYPLVPIALICETLGYTFDFDEENGIMITVPGYENLYDSFTPMSWDFNIPGYFAGWSSTNCELSINAEGALVMKTDSTDPVMRNTLENPVPAEDYDVVEIRARFDGKPKDGWMEIFFLTDKDGTWNQQKAIQFAPGKSSTDGGWWEGKVYLSGVNNWKDNITALRFDPFNATGVTEIDYIKFRKKTEAEIAEEEAKKEKRAKAGPADTSFKSPEEEQTDDGKSIIWSFNGGVGDLNGWFDKDGTSEIKNVSGTSLVFRSKNHPDPYMWYRFETPIRAEDFNVFKIRAIIEFDSDPTKFQLFWTTVESPSVSESKSLVINHDKMTSFSEFLEFAYDLSKHPEWKGEITGLRMDVFNGTDGMFDIDYAKLQAK